MRRSRLALLCGTLAVAVSCGDSEVLGPAPNSPTTPPPAAPTDPSFAISDAVHDGGNSHFLHFWLKPLVSQPASFNGPFDGTLSPVVEICEWTGTDCVMPFTAVFTLTSGPGGRMLKMKPDKELHVARWDTDEIGEEMESGGPWVRGLLDRAGRA